MFAAADGEIDGLGVQWVGLTAEEIGMGVGR
jgi:hypothetical protein